MERFWKAQQLRAIKSGSSIFQRIPNTIGDIVYCDTTEPSEAPLSSDVVKEKRIKALLFFFVSLALYWGFCYVHYIFGIIVTIAVALITLWILPNSFEGTDFFVGKEGFATIVFSGDRANIIDEFIIRFEDCLFLYMNEVINKQNGGYTGTDYTFVMFFTKKGDSTQCFSFKQEGNYYNTTHINHPERSIDPDVAPLNYNYLKKIEEAWTLYFLNKHKSNRVVTFPYWHGTTVTPDAIKIMPDGIEVNGIKYDKNNTKQFYFTNGNLVIESINHEKKWFGLKEKGDIAYISLSQVGNLKAFLFMIDKLMQ